MQVKEAKEMDEIRKNEDQLEKEIEEKFDELKEHARVLEEMYEKNIVELRNKIGHLQRTRPGISSKFSVEIKNVLNGLYKRLQGKFQCDTSYSGSKVLEVVFQTIMDLSSQLSENSNQFVRDQSTFEKGITPANGSYSRFSPRVRIVSLSSPSVPDMMQSQQVLNTPMGTSQVSSPSPVMNEGIQASSASSLLPEKQVETTESNKPMMSHPPTPNKWQSPGAASMSQCLKDERVDCFIQSQPRNGISTLYDLSDDPERKLFLDKLIMYQEILFQEERGRPLIWLWCPTIGRQPLDLYKLYLAVKERGGFVEVMRGDMWEEIAGSLGLRVSSHGIYTVSYVCQMYVTYLLRFECKYDRGGIDPEHLISSLQSKSKKKNAESADKDKEITTLESSAFQCDCPACDVVYKKCHDMIQRMLKEDCMAAQAFKAEQDRKFKDEQLRQKHKQGYLRFKQLLLKFDSPPMFHEDTKEKATGVMDIEDCDLSASSEKLSMENVFSLYASAIKHDVHDQKEACRKFIKNHLSVGTFWETFRQCHQYPELNFIDLFLEFYLRNISQILNDSDKFIALLREYPVEFQVLECKAVLSRPKHRS